MKHGLLTWGSSARESYDRTIELVTRAEEYLAGKETKTSKASRAGAPTSPATAEERYLKVAPILRGLLAVPTKNPDWPHQRFILRSLTDDGERRMP